MTSAPEVTQDAGGEGSRPDSREVQHAESVERTGRMQRPGAAPCAGAARVSLSRPLSTNGPRGCRSVGAVSELRQKSRACRWGSASTCSAEATGPHAPPAACTSRTISSSPCDISQGRSASSKASLFSAIARSLSKRGSSEELRKIRDREKAIAHLRIGEAQLHVARPCTDKCRPDERGRAAEFPRARARAARASTSRRRASACWPELRSDSPRRSVRARCASRARIAAIAPTNACAPA